MRVRDGRAIPNFISQALCGNEVTVYGNGDQTRSFCYISDLVAGVVALAESDLNRPVNIGNPTEMTILQLAESIITATDSSSRIVHKGLPIDDPKIRQPEITRAQTLLNWEPLVSIDKGLSDTIEYFQRKINA